MLDVTKEIKFFQDIAMGNYQAVLFELNYFPIMVELFSSPACALATPIMIAAHSGQTAVFDLLKQRGANLHRFDANGWNLLMHAVASKNEEIIRKVMQSYNSAQLANALVHKNVEGLNVLEYVLKYCPNMIDVLIGAKPASSALDLPTGTAQKGKASELKGSLEVLEEEFFDALNELTADPASTNNDFSKFLKQLATNTLEDEPELVEILQKNKRNEPSHKTSAAQEVSQGKVRILPVTQPLLIHLRNHKRLVSQIDAKVEQASKAAAAKRSENGTGTVQPN